MGPVKRFKKFLLRMRGDAMVADRFQRLETLVRTESTGQKVLLARQLARQACLVESPDSFDEVEFSVFSQFGDDGIIQWLVHRLPDVPRTFVEFGVEDYQQANTRFLLVNNNWSGLVIDGSLEAVEAIRRDSVSWQHDLRAECAFVTAENINQLLLDSGFSGDIGLLHIDIDGNDYWVWKSIEVVNPAIVIVEWNSVLGAERSITIPYDPGFVRVHPPDYRALYCGTSLAALCDLADARGYDFVGSNSAGNNAYFLRRDIGHGLKALSASEGYVTSRFVECVDADGRPIRGTSRLEAIRGMPVIDTRTGRQEAL